MQLKAIANPRNKAGVRDGAQRGQTGAEHRSGRVSVRNPATLPELRFCGAGTRLCSGRPGGYPVFLVSEVQRGGPRLGDTISTRWRRIRPPRPQPIGRPIEDIAASLRRIQCWLDAYADPRPIPGKATKVTAAGIAYDRVLVDACHALEVREALDGTEGLDREAERLRMQAALEDAGLVLRGRRREADR